MKDFSHDEETGFLSKRIARYLETFCMEIENRHVGSQGNRRATDFFAEAIHSFGFETEGDEFDCIDWSYDAVKLVAHNDPFEAFVSPYSLSCNLHTHLAEATTIDTLEKLELTGKILLLHGEIAKEQIMPKNFPFYNPEHHQKIIALLENKKPAAIIAATGKNPELAGAVYPFPMFEDGDFDIPSVYMKDVEGEKLRKYVHEKITVQINSKRIPAKAMNVIARKGDCSKSKIIFCAHIDAKKGTPGALDDGGGIAALLGIAELLTDYSGEKGIEIIAFNGEDYYDAPGQKQYLQQHQSKMEKIELAVNLDGVGYIDGRTGYSFYECPESMENRVKEIMAAHEEIYEGEQWYQGDHMIFVLNQRPAIAFASENFNRIMTEIAHTEKDTVDLVDCKKLAKLACALRDIALKV